MVTRRGLRSLVTQHQAAITVGPRAKDLRGLINTQQFELNQYRLLIIRDRRLKTLHRVLAVASLILLVLGGGIVTARARLAASVSDFLQLAGSLEISEIAPPPVADGDNAAQLYLAAIESLEVEPHENDLLVRRVTPDANGALGPVDTEIRSLVERNRIALSLLLDAAHRPGSNFHLDYGVTTKDMQPVPFDLLLVASLGVIEARSLQQEGRVGEAASMLAAVSRLAESLYNESTLFANLMATGIEKLVLDNADVEGIEDLATPLKPKRDMVDVVRREIALWTAVMLEEMTNDPFAQLEAAEIIDLQVQMLRHAKGEIAEPTIESGFNAEAADHLEQVRRLIDRLNELDRRHRERAGG